MPTYNPAMQKAHLAEIKADEHGLISKKTAGLGCQQWQLQMDGRRPA